MGTWGHGAEILDFRCFGQNYTFEAGQLHFDLVWARIDPRFDVSERSKPLLPAQELVDFFVQNGFSETHLN